MRSATPGVCTSTNRRSALAETCEQTFGPPPLDHRADGQALRASYEDLCERPAPSLARIGRIAGLDFSKVASRIETGGSLQVPAHMIRGNAQLRSEGRVHLVAR